jgi:hypothetical protein
MSLRALDVLPWCLFGLMVTGAACTSFTAATTPEDAGTEAGLLETGSLEAGTLEGSVKPSPDTGPSRCAKGEKLCNGTCQDVKDPTFGCDPQSCSKCELANVDKHSCSDGSCRLVKCLAGKYDCDGDPKNGCESATTCGTTSCADGVLCAGNCILNATLMSDSQNCGGCGMQCGAGQTCSGGLCSKACTPLAGGGTNGACGVDSCSAKACAGNEGCEGATCTACAQGTIPKASSEAGCEAGCVQLNNACTGDTQCCAMSGFSIACDASRCCLSKGTKPPTSFLCCSRAVDARGLCN